MKATIFYSRGNVTHMILNSHTIEFNTEKGLKIAFRKVIFNNIDNLTRFYGSNCSITAVAISNKTGNELAKTIINI